MVEGANYSPHGQRPWASLYYCLYYRVGYWGKYRDLGGPWDHRPLMGSCVGGSIASVCVGSWTTCTKELGKSVRHRARRPRHQGGGQSRGRAATGELHFLFGAGCGPVLGGGAEGAQKVAKLGGGDLLAMARASRCCCEQLGCSVGLVGKAVGGVRAGACAGSAEGGVGWRLSGGVPEGTGWDTFR